MNPNRPLQRNSRGFTLVEALVAMLFVAVLLPVVIQALLTANRAGVLAERARLAVELADRKLTEILLTDAWRDGDAEGDFGEEYSGFRWRAYSDDWSEDTMRAIHVTVMFTVQGREYETELVTLAENEEES